MSVKGVMSFSYVTSVVCTFLSALLGILLVWRIIPSGMAGRVLLTTLIIFLASSLTLSVGRTFVGRR